MFPPRWGLRSLPFPNLRLGCGLRFSQRRGEVRCNSRIGRIVLIRSINLPGRCCAGVAQTLPPIPLDAYNLCAFVRHRALEVAYTSISLLYGACDLSQIHWMALTLPKPDFLAFLLIIFLTVTSRTPGLKIPIILEVVAKDSTRYFLVIFTSHFVFEMTLNLGDVSMALFSSRVQSMTLVSCLQDSIQLLPAA